MQSQDPRNLVEDSLLDDRDRSPGKLLLGGLEDHADPARELSCLLDAAQRERGSQHHGGVDVMPAGVGDALDSRGVVELGFLQHRQRVDVSAQGQADGAFTDVHVGSGAFHLHRVQPGGAQGFKDAFGGLEFSERKLRVAVQFAAELDQLGR